MKSKRILTAGCVALLCCMTAALAYGQKKVKLKGLITQRTGETVVMKPWGGGTVTLILDDDTKVQKPKGLGLRNQQMSAAVLIPGLKISVEGVEQGEGQVLAKKIDYDQQDLEDAEMVQAGLTPTKHQVQTNVQDIAANKQAAEAGIAANKQGIAANQQQIAATQQDVADTQKRFNELTEYETKGDIMVNFATGSSVVSPEAQAALADLAHKAVNYKGYIMQVKGFASTSGGAAMNQQLSMDRADAVIAYLIQKCNIPVRHIVAPGAMGTTDPVATNETKAGRKENQRVEVKVLVNKGLAAN